MSTDSSQRQGWPLSLSGAILLVGLIDELVGLTGWEVWQWLVGAGLAVALLASIRQGRARRIVRVLTVTAGVGAGLYLSATVGYLAADAAGLRVPTPLQALFMVGALSLLAGILLASASIGCALIRRGASTRSAGWLLLAVGVLILTPLPALLGAAVPDAVPLTGVTVLAVLLGVLGTRTSHAVPGDTGGG